MTYSKMTVSWRRSLTRWAPSIRSWQVRAHRFCAPSPMTPTSSLRATLPHSAQGLCQPRPMTELRWIRSVPGFRKCGSPTPKLTSAPRPTRRSPRDTPMRRRCRYSPLFCVMAFCIVRFVNRAVLMAVGPATTRISPLFASSLTATPAWSKRLTTSMPPSPGYWRHSMSSWRWKRRS